jgi:signal transduction histidine kinase
MALDRVSVEPSFSDSSSEQQREQRAYLMHMRHELRTPLNAIIGYSEILLEDAGEEPYAADISRILRCGQQLLGLVNDILHTSKIELDEVLDMQAVGASIRHELRTPLNAVIGYCEMLQEEAEDAAWLPEIQKIHQAGKKLCSLIEDIVQFSASPQWNRKISTAGDSTASMVHATVSSIPSLWKRPLVMASGNLLVVDDNEMNRDLLASRLSRQGYTVRTCEDGACALELLRQEAFDLVLLDVMMPGLNGFQVLERVKTDADLRHIPVIMISALDEIDSAVRCIEIGAEDFLAKPFDPVLLQARVTASLEKKRLRDQEVRLHQQLADNYQRLQELEALRDSLTGMMVHDLRTPLTSLSFGLQLVGQTGTLNEQQKECLDISMSGAQTLLSMINDLLDISKMEAGSLQLEYSTLQPPELIIRSIEQVSELAKQAGQKLNIEMPDELPSLAADEDKLRRTLVNLLGNAIKFTPQGGTVTVSCAREESGQHLKFSVVDTGEGIPLEAFEKIFEKFGQVDSRKSGRRMSTGLGLTFCKMAVEAHGGQIAVQSTLGQGSTFWFVVPLEPVVQGS